MPMRLSGLMSGMDTESIIQQMVEAKKTKVTKAIKAQKSLKYKQDAWKDLNKQILNLYNKSLGNMRFESSFIKKVTKVSNSNAVSVITGEGAMNSVQTLDVISLAKSGYLTGGKIGGENGKTVAGEDITETTKLSELGFTGSGSIKVTTGEGQKDISLNGDMTIKSFVSAVKSAGLTANFDAANGRIHIASKSSGKDNDFSIMANNVDGVDALNVLQLSYTDGLKDLKANENDTISKRQTSELNRLTANWNSALANREKILESFTEDDINKINAKLSGSGFQLGDPDLKYSDLTDAQWNKIDQAIKGVITDAALKKWTDNQAQIDDIKGKLKFDGDGKPVDLTDAVKADIETTVKKEIQDALDAWDKLQASSSDAVKTAGKDAEIKLNGISYTSDKNSLEVNGLTFIVSATTSESVTITTEDDTNGVYDMVKGFIKEYNALINQMDKLYNADSAKGYEPLTDEEKDAMSDSAIEEWENKVKDSILRKDSVLGTFANELKMLMMGGVEVDGRKMYLSDFGIGTLSYFSALENEKSAYHIDGDPDDESTSGNADKLKSMIANDPDTVVSFFTTLSQKMYDKMFDLMRSKEGYSSAMTAYDDKKMQKDYDDYTTKIKELEKKLADYEDKWYAKFAAMETALAKMQNNASAVTSLLGG
ncbi:MAG: flagellar filament capping protein FliD [Lachnospiraceae bacterium]|nr:flagellar filament capping protein FliD [Lachnospiraceae bacterium]